MPTSGKAFSLSDPIWSERLTLQGLEVWFNTAAFAVPPPFTFGNLGRNGLLGPGFQSWDFGVFKNIPIREGVRLQFRSEFFNAFNNINLGSPASLLGNPDFGQISSTVTPQRQIQFGLKLIF